MLFYFLQLLVLSLMIGLAFYAKMKYFSDPLPLENGGSAEKAINSKSGVTDQSRRGLSKYRSSKGNQRTLQGLECPGTVVVTEKQKRRAFTAFVVTAHNAVLYVYQSCCFTVDKLIGMMLLPWMIVEGIINRILILFLHSFCISYQKLANRVCLVSI